MAKTKPIALRLDENRIRKIKEKVEEKGYSSDSELIREAIDEKLDEDGLYVKLPKKDRKYLGGFVESGDQLTEADVVRYIVRRKRIEDEKKE